MFHYRLNPAGDGPRHSVLGEAQFSYEIIKEFAEIYALYGQSVYLSPGYQAGGGARLLTRQIGANQFAVVLDAIFLSTTARLENSDLEGTKQYLVFRNGIVWRHFLSSKNGTYFCIELSGARFAKQFFVTPFMGLGFRL